ncbi:hypothetical protein ZWY2020_030265 [Hordeum vulgare]|nr:hypothetical protein ZWY2020_030265 [Hordeum vulgare]
MQERFSRESTEAVAALKTIAGVFRPLLDNFHHLLSLKTVYDTEDYHISMPFGAFIACFGCYQLWKMDSRMFLTAALGYTFYKLSVVSSQLRKQGFANGLITGLNLKQAKYAVPLLLFMIRHPEGRRELHAMLSELKVELVSECGIAVI